MNHDYKVASGTIRLTLPKGINRIHQDSGQNSMRRRKDGPTHRKIPRHGVGLTTKWKNLPPKKSCSLGISEYDFRAQSDIIC